MTSKPRNRRVITAVLLSGVLLGAIPARGADIAPYEDRDSNVLKVAYYFVYPVGKIAEFLIFRPLHTISALTQPDPDELRASEDQTPYSCLSMRPERHCGHTD